MLKKWTIILIMLLVMPISVFAQDIPERPTTAGYVFDFENVIDDAVEADINEVARLLQAEGKMELMIVTVPTIGELEPYEYGMKFFREWGIGDTEKDNGLLIYATTQMGEGNNVIRISTGYGLEGDYTDGETKLLIDTYMKEALKAGDYTAAFAQVVEAIREKEEVDYTWNSDYQSIVADLDSNSEIEEESSWFWELPWYLILFLLAVFFVLGMLGAYFGIVFIFVLIAEIFRAIPGIFYGLYKVIFRKEIRTKRYYKYMEKKKQNRLKGITFWTRLKAALIAGIAALGSSSGDGTYSSSSGGSSYSYGGGDSGGGGSDDRF